MINPILEQIANDLEYASDALDSAIDDYLADPTRRFPNQLNLHDRRIFLNLRTLIDSLNDDERDLLRNRRN